MPPAVAQGYDAENLYDDPAISDDELLVRHISRHFLVDDAGGGKRVSSQAFRSKKPARMSVNLGGKLVEDGLPLNHPVAGLRDCVGIAIFTAGIARELGDGVAWTPKPDDNTGPANPYHADVLGFSREGQARSLVRAAQFDVQV